jgi:hypothetical protein
MALIAENLIHRASSLSLSFSLEKTDLIHFFKPKNSTKPKDISQIPPLQTALSSAMPTPFIVNPSENIRLLGITLDSTLSFTSHLAQAASAGRQALGSFNFLRTTSLGISAKTAHYIAILAILPKMLYGSQVWWAGSIKSLTPILSTYNQIARWITGFPRSTRIKNLLMCANLPPLEATLSNISCNYGIRLLFLPHNHPAAIPISDDFNARKLPGTDHVLSQVKGMYANRLEDRSAPSPISILPYHTRVHTSRAPDSDITHSTWIKTLPPSSFRLYTDGSKPPSGYLGSGWALYGKAKDGIENTQIASGFCNLGIESEVFDAELYAVHEGLSFLATSDFLLET